MNGISAPLTVNGDAGTDTLNIDDTGDTDLKSGVLSATRITGLGMSEGITYQTFENLDIGLGGSSDLFTIASTHVGMTTFSTNAGNETVHMVTMNLSAGWNLISLPLVTSNTSVSELFPEAKVVYGFDPKIGYYRQTKLEIGKGYWLLIGSAQTYTFTGLPFTEYTKSVDGNRWDMIGGCSVPVKVSVVNGGIGVIYRFVPEWGYQRLSENDHLEPGMGYWICYKDIRVGAELQMTPAVIMKMRSKSGLPSPSTPENETDQTTEKTTLTKTDTSDNTQEESLAVNESTINETTSEDQEASPSEKNIVIASSEPVVETDDTQLDIINNSVLSPGDSPGILNLRDFSQGPTGILLIDIGGTTPGFDSDSYDQVNASGEVNLEGTLEIVLWNGFVPSIGDSFEILTYGSIIGHFENYMGMEFSDGLRFVPIQDEARLTLIVSQIPENQIVSDIEIHSDTDEAVTIDTEEVPTHILNYMRSMENSGYSFIDRHIVERRNTQAYKKDLVLIAKALRFKFAMGWNQAIISKAPSDNFIRISEGIVGRSGLLGQIAGTRLSNTSFLSLVINRMETSHSERVNVKGNSAGVDLTEGAYIKAIGTETERIADTDQTDQNIFQMAFPEGGKALGALLAFGPFLGAAALGMENQIRYQWFED